MGHARGKWMVGWAVVALYAVHAAQSLAQVPAEKPVDSGESKPSAGPDTTEPAETSPDAASSPESDEAVAEPKQEETPTDTEAAPDSGRRQGAEPNPETKETISSEARERAARSAGTSGDTPDDDVDAEAPVAPGDEVTADQPRELRRELEGKDQTGSPPPPPRDTDELPPQSAPPGEERPLPNYDSRATEHTSAGDVLVWVPRTVLFPLHLATEYLVRRPLVWTVTKIEQYHVPQRVEQALSWDDGKATLLPLIFVDWGIRPNVGLALQWNEFAPKHDVYAAGFVGPNDLFASAFNLEQRLFRDDSAAINWIGGYIRRPDNVFFGLQDDQDSPCLNVDRGCRYRTAIGEAHFRVSAFEDYLSGVQFDTMLRHARFSTDADIPSVPDSVAETLPGFDDDYLLFRPELHVTLDTRARDVDFTRGTGMRIEGFGSYNMDLESPSSRWFRAGGEAAGFYDFGTGKIVGIRMYAETIVNRSSDTEAGERIPVPFHELIRLGGSERMRGFLDGRLRGSTAWTATFEYRYPILWALDAAWFTSIGNVYPTFDEFDFEKNYLNYGFSLRTSGNRAQAFEALIGFGSNRLDSNDFRALDQFRLTVGVNQGF